MLSHEQKQEIRDRELLLTTGYSTLEEVNPQTSFCRSGKGSTTVSFVSDTGIKTFRMSNAGGRPFVRWQVENGRRSATSHLQICSEIKSDLTAPASCLVSTEFKEFNLTLSEKGELGTFYVQAWLDSVMVAHSPITLRRAG